jgi:hypothetical protein
MTVSLYDASLAVFDRQLGQLDGMLDKLAAHCAARNLDPAVFLTARLFPDMFACARQIQIACDFAKGAAARLGGFDNPKFEDTETTPAEFKDRIARTRALIAQADRATVDAAADKIITLKIGPNEMQLSGTDYILRTATPNFYFHLSMVYAILRHNGVELGKGDFVAR